MHIQCKEDTPIQVDHSVEVMDKLQGFSFHGKQSLLNSYLELETLKFISSTRQKEIYIFLHIPHEGSWTFSFLLV